MGSNPIFQPISAYRIEAFDVDRDGDEDLLFDHSSISDGRLVSWSENIDGQLQTPTVLHENAAGERSSVLPSVFQFDTNEDGIEDLVSRGQGGLSWFSNFRDANETTSTPAGFSLFSVGDIDGDNDLDWVGSNSQGDNVFWFDGVGDEFTARKIQATDFRDAQDLDAIDIDGDGDLDAILKTDGELKWYENTGGGEFGSIATLMNVPEYSFQDFADFNGDGRIDIAHSYFDRVAGKGVISWQPNSTIGFVDPIVLDGTGFVSYSDIDGDGDTDYIVSGVPHVGYLNDGAGNFSSSFEIPPQGEFHFLAADADGDGDQDLFASFRSEELFLFRNTGEFTYERQVAVPSRPMPGTSGLISLDYSDYELADLDGDGLAEIVVTCDVGFRPIADGGLTQWIEVFQYQNGEYHSVVEIAPGNLMGNPVELSDLDGDGDLDISIASSNRPSYFENLGGLEFEAGRSIALGNNRSIDDYAMADVTGDGLPDLLALMNGEDRLSLLTNDLRDDSVIVTSVEIDRVFRDIREGANDEENDWNEDGIVNVADVDYLLEIAGTVRGDANLDGRVDFADFLQVLRSFGTDNVGWAGGDFDGDGKYGFADFLIIAETFGFDTDDE